MQHFAHSGNFGFAIPRIADGQQGQDVAGPKPRRRFSASEARSRDAQSSDPKRELQKDLADMLAAIDDEFDDEDTDQYEWVKANEESAARRNQTPMDKAHKHVITTCPSPKFCPRLISTAYGVAIHRRSAIAPSNDRHYWAIPGRNPSPLLRSSYPAAGKSRPSPTTRGAEAETSQAETGGVR